MMNAESLPRSIDHPKRKKQEGREEGLAIAIILIISIIQPCLLMKHVVHVYAPSLLLLLLL